VSRQFRQEPCLISHPSNGITQGVIREMLPPYQFSDDLPRSTFAALPPPDASAAWRPAQIPVVRELADTLATPARAPDLTVA
jgi:hypothetical protein